jgi:ribosomal protein S18 acetylase RimI-like enzyme
LLDTVASAVDLPDSTFQVRLVRRDEHVELRAVRLSALAYSAHLAEHLAKENAEGASFLTDDRRIVEVGGMWVTPSVRRSGVGRDLLAAVCAWARSRGAERTGLWVRSDNQPARSLYEREGFEVVSRSESSGTRGLRLEREL